ncbi:MAG: 5'-methylthioadenosine/adenosylhomocysteine nucleosidase [Kiritimatiellae bacterium]|nr:5'-methylthioadenosine/adenosylhomocysteine nucleosidase [Kiritimatiellia bacterium]
MKPIAIVAAMPQERKALLHVFPEYKEYVHYNTCMFETALGEQKIIIVESGVGKVNAACTLALLLSDFDPCCVINTGSAGGMQPGQNILDIVVPDEVVYTDVDVTPLGFEYGQILGSPPRFKSCPNLHKHLNAVLAEIDAPPACHRGLLGSADSFIYKESQIESIKSNFADQVQCVEMEGGAIAHVCSRFGVPFLILRALSDVPNRGDNAMDFNTFLPKAAAMSAQICLKLVQRIALNSPSA